MWLAGTLPAAVVVWALWHAWDVPDGRAVSAGGAPASSPLPTSSPTQADTSRVHAEPDSFPLPPAATSAEGNSSPGTETADPERVMDGVVTDVATLSLERLGDRFVDYLVGSGLAPADSEDIVMRSFRAAARCSLEAMRDQSRAESVPFDIVLEALYAELYDMDGPLLSSVIDLQAVGVREAPCALNALQEAGIPPSAAQDILRTAGTQ
jgi:hypothetical protein